MTANHSKWQGYQPIADVTGLGLSDAPGLGEVPSLSLTSADPRLRELTMMLFGHAAFQYLHAACELGLFEFLTSQPGANRDDIAKALDLRPRPADILVLGVTSLGLVNVEDGNYRVGDSIDQLFRLGQWQRFRDVVEFEAHIVYEGQADFVESLRADQNVGLRRIPGKGRDLYHRLTENPDLEQIFYRYMRSWSEISNPVMLRQVDFSRFRSVLDVGGGDGVNAIALARAFPDLEVTVFEIEATAGLVRKRIADAGLTDRVRVHVGDFFSDDFPAGHDCILFAHQLVIWTLDDNTDLLTRAHAALPDNGSVVIFNSMASDDLDGPLMAALDSVYFASTPASGGMIYAWRQYEQCLRTAGFTHIERFADDSWTPHGVLVATK